MGSGRIRLRRESSCIGKNLREGGWPKKNPQFFEDLKEDLAHVEYFEFTGGEPFMIKGPLQDTDALCGEGICQEH